MPTITRGFAAITDRYRFDSGVCRNSKGWAQLDTKQDASYFGNWVNPLTLELFSYCEGDLTHTACSSEQDFIDTLTETINWHKEREYYLGIDPGWPDTVACDRIRSAFIVLGFADELH